MTSHDTRNAGLSRREALKVAGLGAAGLAVGGLPLGALGSSCVASVGPPAGGRELVARIGHLSDTHVQPERRAAEGLEACLAHVQARKDKVDLIITGGDSIMDCFEQNEARTTLQWDIWQKAWKHGNSLPVHSVVGNHDVWGWNKGDSRCTGQELRYGKKWACEMFGRERSFTSFDVPSRSPGSAAKWHVVLLDSIAHDPNDPHGYIGELGDEQTDWLKSDLAALDRATPVMIVSHIPILSATVLLGEPNKAHVREVGSGVIHADSTKLRDLFAQHSSIKCCLSGHMHRIDRVDFRGVSYLCNGAVSGNWWKGAHYECNEGYAVMELYSDGSFDAAYETYGWKAERA
ncbi:MAG: metallophosphoesterase [Phycisphaerales bacterium]|nr:metallophosphoesterase [Phycisphaerales bacterium]